MAVATIVASNAVIAIDDITEAMTSGRLDLSLAGMVLRGGVLHAEKKTCVAPRQSSILPGPICQCLVKVYLVIRAVFRVRRISIPMKWFMCYCPIPHNCAAPHCLPVHFFRDVGIYPVG